MSNPPECRECGMVHPVSWCPACGACDFGTDSQCWNCLHPAPAAWRADQ